MSRSPDLTLPLATDLFSYDLPQERIAQQPVEPRDTARLLVIGRSGGLPCHHVFRDLPDLLAPGDLLVMNRSRVLPARLLGSSGASGGAVELLLLRRLGPARWQALGKPGRRLRPGARLLFADGALRATVEEVLGSGDRIVAFDGEGEVDARVLAAGKLPLPHYIYEWHGDPERYQTVYGDMPGSAAAPTAGLHFTNELLDRLAERGIGRAYVTLHVGVDTFRPIRTDTVDEHEMHAELVDVPPETLTAIAETRRRDGRVIAVGTTTVRSLESVPRSHTAGGWSGWTRLFIRPGAVFRNLDGMITNFHLPRSTLLVLVSAFTGRERLLQAYDEAIQRGYRFYSFGDAMLIMDGHTA